MVAFPMLAAACALAGVPGVADRVRRRFLAERERELGIRIPAAVAEWYAIDGAVEHLIQESCAIIVRLEQLGTASDGRDLAAGGSLWRRIARAAAIGWSTLPTRPVGRCRCQG
jgi:hypothetical protein